MSPASICPTCKRRAAPHSENPAHPFCGRSCKLADLSNWFNERYVVPDQRASLEDMPDEPEILH